MHRESCLSITISNFWTIKSNSSAKTALQIHLIAGEIRLKSFAKSFAVFSDNLAKEASLSGLNAMILNEKALDYEHKQQKKIGFKNIVGEN
jgi:hypothetical protein